MTKLGKSFVYFLNYKKFCFTFSFVGKHVAGTQFYRIPVQTTELSPCQIYEVRCLGSSIFGDLQDDSFQRRFIEFKINFTSLLLAVCGLCTLFNKRHLAKFQWYPAALSSWSTVLLEILQTNC